MGLHDARSLLVARDALAPLQLQEIAEILGQREQMAQLPDMTGIALLMCLEMVKRLQMILKMNHVLLKGCRQHHQRVLNLHLRRNPRSLRRQHRPRQDIN